MDAGPCCLLFSPHHAQPSMLGWQAEEKDISPSLHKFNGLFALIPKGQGGVREEGIACCESPLVHGLLEEGAAYDGEHGMPEITF